MQRSFKARLAALEQLEQEAEAQIVANADIPDVAAMDDDEALWEAVLSVRKGQLLMDLCAPSGRVVLRATSYLDARWRVFFVALADRVQPMIDAMAKPIVFLASWEVADAIAAIDAGECRLVTHYVRRVNDILADGAGLCARGQWSEGADPDLCDTLVAVDEAYNLVNRQIYYPQPRDFSTPAIATLAGWRAWLVSVGGQSE
jgi:hypothetical protein